MNYIIIALSAVFAFSIIRPCFSFKWATHLKAIPKATFILIVSFLPALLAIFNTGQIEVLRMNEIFIYAASFLAPVIYWFREDFARKVEIRGNWFLLLYTAVILVVTAAYFKPPQSEPSLEVVATKAPWIVAEYPYFPVGILLVTLVLWYFTIASEKAESSYTEEKDKEEKDFLKKSYVS
jgi:hypothetical protein